jgi:putative endonuclease
MLGEQPQAAGVMRALRVCRRRALQPARGRALDRELCPRAISSLRTMTQDRRRSLGHRGEQLAGAHLRTLGFHTLARNVRTRHGEIDLIAFDGHALIFTEVKTRCVSVRARTVREDQDPLRGLGQRQRLRLRKLATAWLVQSAGRRPRAETVRFDAIGVVIDTSGTLRRLDHVPDAY